MYGLYLRAASNQERPMMAHVRYKYRVLQIGNSNEIYTFICLGRKAVLDSAKIQI
jgi:hypothetical protein